MPLLVTKHTLRFFEILNLSQEFLDKDPESWNDLDDYQRAKTVVKGLQVVNDHSEWSVKLMSDFNQKITKKESQFQDLLQTCAHYRRAMPDVKKSTLSKQENLAM